MVSCKLPLLSFASSSSSSSCCCSDLVSKMGFSVEYSGLVITHLIYRATLILTVARSCFCWALRYMGLSTLSSSASDDDHSSQAEHHTQVGQPSSCSSGSSISAQMIRESLNVSMYGDIAGRLPESCNTCAVCLNELRKRDKVRELRNCCHVFHKRCIDRWLDHDDQKTCPLCRAPLLAFSTLGLTRSEPSWAVERLLYLFGDDLL